MDFLIEFRIIYLEHVQRNEEIDNSDGTEVDRYGELAERAARIDDKQEHVANETHDYDDHRDDVRDLEHNIVIQHDDSYVIFCCR